MLQASLTFSNPSWMLPALAIAAAILTLAFLSMRYAPPGAFRWICPVLKLAGVLGLLVCLLEPLWTGQHAKPGANALAVVADNSEGLQVKDQGSAITRGEKLRNLLASPHSGWQGSLEENFDLRRYYFDSRLHGSQDFQELAFDGRSSAIGAALNAVRDRLRGRPAAGIVLLTDGIATDMRAAADLKEMPPVYPVVIGDTVPVKDIALQQVSATETDFEDTPVSVQAQVSACGYSGEVVAIRVLDESGKVAAEQKLRARASEEALTYRFQFRPEKAGLSFYRVEVKAPGEADSQEATLVNNSQVLPVTRGRGPYRILYVAGRPNWEFKFLNRALDEDPQLQLVGLLRVARREPRFNFIGRPGETSNPLFRGFGNQSVEEVERYDQPVLVRMNTRDEAELHAGFPTTAEELYSYHAVIVGDLEAEFFTPDQAVLLQKFVSERGGGFLMLGGTESFEKGKYQRTAIGDMLPVYVDRFDEGQSSSGWRLDLTREGILQTWARLRDNEADEKSRLLGMPSFQVVNRIREAKPGALTVANVTDNTGKQYPAITVQRFGNGRTAAVLIGDLWRWGLHDPESHRDMDKSWRQLARWLVTDAPNQVEVAVESRSDTGPEGAAIKVQVRDAKFQPMDDARITVEVEPVLVEEHTNARISAVRFQAEHSTSAPGTYETSFVPRVPGGYRATAWVTNAAGVEVGHAVAGWSTAHDAGEFRSLRPNVALLEDIARRTGGEVLTPEKLAQFAQSLPRRTVPVMEAWTYPLWHTPALFAFALTCLVVEWGLRRSKGLP